MPAKILVDFLPRYRSTDKKKMSKPEIPDRPYIQPDPDEQVKRFVDLFRDEVEREKLAHLRERTRGLGLDFSEDELGIIAALDTPEKVQSFLNTQIYYNNDHATPETEETAMPPKRVLRTARAHCFEGAMFAYTVNYLHGHSPQLILLEASQDSDHNLVLYRDPRTSLLGVNAHSRFKKLDGRPARYKTIREVAESYYPHYYSDRTLDPKDLTLVGYSEPFDLIPKFGVEWMATEEPLWDIYYLYVDETVKFHYLFDDSEKSHEYPLVRALRERWIQTDREGRPFVSVNELPHDALDLWNAFWREYDRKNPRPLGKARQLEREFQKLTGTTPLDLEENADELGRFLRAGYRIEQLVTKIDS
jgi:hypothetical protein